MLRAAVSSDIDTLASIYGGFDLRRPGGYSYAEFRMGLENFCTFLGEFGIKATMFMVGQDFRQPNNLSTIRGVLADGHEIANHTLSHAQGFRLLSPAEKEAEIAGMEEVCEAVTGRRPVGFRSPGWNIGDDAGEILRRRGYLYDSSVFPSSMNPLLKYLHWRSTSRRSGGDRSTLGHLWYMFAPSHPYRTALERLSRRGRDGIMELPVTVVPILRLPFFATFTLATGYELFRASYRALRALDIPIQYQFHLSDFVDYGHPDLGGQVPSRKGVYVPQALRTPLAEKLALFRRVIELIAGDYDFLTLEEWATEEAARLPGGHAELTTAPSP